MTSMANKNRFAVVETIYFQQTGAQPIPIDSRFSRHLGSNEQAYIRHLQIGEEWTSLEMGWLDKCGIGMLAISNEEGKHLQVQPTQEERAAMAAKVVEIGFRDEVADVLVRPGESTRFEPGNARTIYIRCRAGIASCVLNLMPA